MIIVKYLYLVILLITTIACKMKNENFNIYGDEELLKNSKINIVEIDDLGNEKTKTLLFLGNKKIVEPKTETSAIYKVYISYKDSLVNVLKFENIMRNANDHINYLYLNKENDLIMLRYVGRESEIETKKGFGIFLLTKEEYYKVNNIEKEDVKKNNELFFSEY